MTEAAQESNQPAFNIEKVYVRDLSLEIPHAPNIFLERESPQIDVQLSTQTEPIEKDVYEVMITNTVTAKVGEKVMFLIEVKQAGIFQIRNMPPADLEPTLAVMCSNILFPYLREVVSDVAVRAGFAPILLNPVNFERLYQTRQSKLQTESTATTH